MENSQNISAFCLHDKVAFYIDGDGKLNEYLQYQYDYFRKKSNASSETHTNIRLTCQTNELDPDILHKNGNESYGIDGNSKKFFWAHGTSSLMLDGEKSLVEQSHLVFDKAFNNMKANTILDLIWRLHFISSGFVLVHAAAVSKNGCGLLLPAWKSMGKTATCMKLIESGYDYLGDDRVWLNAESIVLAYPRYVVLKDSNINHFPEFMGLVTRVKLILNFFINKIQVVKRSAFLQRLIKKFLKIPPLYKYIEELYPVAKTINKVNLSQLLYIRKIKHTKSVDFQNIAKETVIENIQHIGNVEWNYELLFLASAHDMLFPNSPKWTEEIQNLIHQERQVLEQAFSQVNCFQVSLPEKEKQMSWDTFLAEVKKT